jgi:hypothetical protein
MGPRLDPSVSPGRAPPSKSYYRSPPLQSPDHPVHWDPASDPPLSPDQVLRLSPDPRTLKSICRCNHGCFETYPYPFTFITSSSPSSSSPSPHNLFGQTPLKTKKIRHPGGSTGLRQVSPVQYPRRQVRIRHQIPVQYPESSDPMRRSIRYPYPRRRARIHRPA